MWRYQNTDELYHFGVPGMKWGRRRAMRQQLKQLKQQRNSRYSQIDNKYNSGIKDAGKNKKAQDKMYNYYDREVMKTHSEYSNKKKAIKSEYKQANQQERSNIKNTTKSLYKKDGAFKVAGYGRNVYKQAAKDIVRNGSSQQEALKKQKKKAIVKSALVTAAAAGYAGYQLSRK